MISVITAKNTQNLLVEEKFKMDDDLILKSPSDLFYSVITDFKSETSLFAYIYTNEIHLEDELHGVWESKNDVYFNDIVVEDKA